MDHETRDTILRTLIRARAVLVTCHGDTVADLDSLFRKDTLTRAVEELTRTIELISTKQMDGRNDNEQTPR